MKRVVKTREGWLYLSVFIDVCSRAVVGWSMSDRVTATGKVLPYQYDVLEIPVNHLRHRDSVKTYIDQIQRKMIEMPADDGNVSR